MTDDNSPAKPWGGRFTESTDAFVEAFTASVGFDQRLYRYDIAGSIAHARMLAHVAIISEHGGECRANTDVERILEQKGRVQGVVTTDGTRYLAEKVVCNVTPTQLYGRLLADAPITDDVRQQAQSFRYGRAAMQIHLALNAPPAWQPTSLADVALIHVTPGAGGVSRAVNEAERGYLPEAATIAVGQPAVLDPSRVPAGNSLLWLQLLELPRVIRGDAAGQIPVPADGAWNDTVKEAYADRIVSRLEKHLPGLQQSILSRIVLGPQDLVAMNRNLEGGDPYAGAATLDQFQFWRPLRATKNHATPVRGLYHIGASTHPGAGLGGVSGYQVAARL